MVPQKIFHPIMLSKQTSSKLTFSYFLLYKRGRVKNYKHVWVSQQYALICTTCTIVHSHQLFLVSVSLAKIVKNVLQTSKLMLTFSVIKAVYNLQKFVLKKLKLMSEFLMVSFYKIVLTYCEKKMFQWLIKTFEMLKFLEHFFEKWKVNSIFLSRMVFKLVPWTNLQKKLEKRYSCRSSTLLFFT